MKRPKAAIFASGTGSNFDAIMSREDLACDIALLVCDKPEAIVLEKAEQHAIPTFVFIPKSFSSKAAYEQKLVEELHDADVEWVFLAGYMRIVGPTLLKAFEGKVINIHPSLLPDFPGKDAIGQAYRVGVKTTGVTVHYVDAGVDTGPVIAQKEVPVLPSDTLSDLEQRIHRAEHQLYPEVLNRLILKK